MTYKFLFTVFLTSLSSIGAIAPIAVAQERPKCYLIDSSGQLTDLTEICDASQKRSPNPAPTTNDSLKIINNKNNIIGSEPLATEVVEYDNTYILGEDNFSFDSNFIDSSYYIDNEIGMDYTAYLRQYRVSPTSITRQVSRKQVFQFDNYPSSLTSLLRQGRSRIPFIIYRYPM